MRPGYLVVVGVALPLLAVFACSKSYESAAAPDAGTDAAAAGDDDGKASPTPDATTGDLDASAENEAGTFTIELADGGGVANCWDFTKTKGGFDATGNATYAPDAGGWLLTLDSTNFNAITGSFDAGATYTTTSLRVDQKLTRTGNFAGDGQFVDALTQFYGPSPTVQSTAHNGIELVNGGIEVDVWSSGGDGLVMTFEVPDSTAPFSELDGPMWLDTQWAQTGRVDLSVGTRTSDSRATVSTVAPSSAYSLQIGGAQSANADPTVTILVRSVCVAFH